MTIHSHRNASTHAWLSAREPEKKPNVADFIREGKIALVIRVSSLHVVGDQERILKDEYMIRRVAFEFNVPILTNLEFALTLARMLDQNKENRLTIHSLGEHFRARV